MDLPNPTAIGAAAGERDTDLVGISGGNKSKSSQDQNNEPLHQGFLS
jgi:hypothetical protein